MIPLRRTSLEQNHFRGTVQVDSGCVANSIPSSMKQDRSVASQENEKLEQLFSAALEKDTWQARDAYLSSACADDPQMRDKVEKLLRAHGDIGSFLDTPPIDPNATVEVGAPGEVSEQRIGRYRILEEIGEGGFGTVHLAEQEHPVRRKVALKIIKLGMDTKQVIARFEAERQALALMDHPNIARVLDAGATDNGRPFFVMELVRGEAITCYCDRNKMSMRERLELFLAVCQAVQHAHQKGIIHRDLKPTNVLVTLSDGRPIPKVIDFGIAKATTQRLTDKTLHTEFRQFIGTPEYMSPDQAEMSGLDVDTRTDIYSLGVLLYELLTSTTPFQSEAMRDTSYEEIRRIIREVDPPTPSVRLQTLTTTNGEVAAIAQRRRLDPQMLSRLLRGDLDWIVMKAMEKDRTRRYDTAKDLADDIERHLRHEPVLAGPPQWSYRIGKFVRRHRVSVLAGTMIGIAVVAGISLATVGLIKAQQASLRANNSAIAANIEANKSATVSKFLQDMLRSVDPSLARGREVTVRFVLDEAARKIEEGYLTAEPEVEASLRMTLGETYTALGQYGTAAEHLQVAQALLQRYAGPEAPETLLANRALASVMCVEGQFAEAEILLRETVDTMERVLGPEAPETLNTINELAISLWGPGRYEEAEPMHRTILEAQRRVLGEKHLDTLESIGNIGSVCRALGKNEEADIYLGQALELYREILGDDHPLTAEAMNNVGLLREDQRRYSEAEEIYRAAYEIDRQILGPDHPRTLIPMDNLLRVLSYQGKTAERRPLIQERLERLKRVAENSADDPLALNAYAWELLYCEVEDLRDPAAALPVAERAVELDAGRDPTMLETLAYAFSQTGNFAQAIKTQEQAISLARAGGPYDRKEMEDRRTEYLIASGDVLGVASASWADGVASMIGSSLRLDASESASLIRKAEAHIRNGAHEQAAEVLERCRNLQLRNLPPDHWQLSETNSLLGTAIAGMGDDSEAEQLLVTSYTAMVADSSAPSDKKELALHRLIDFYTVRQRFEQADQYRDSALKHAISPPE